MAVDGYSAVLQAVRSEIRQGRKSKVRAESHGGVYSTPLWALHRMQIRIQQADGNALRARDEAARRELLGNVNV